jgi:hypothetical protein
MALATAYAKAFRRAIPDDEGLSVRGRGARRVESELGITGRALFGALLGAGLGTAVAVVRDGIRCTRDRRRCPLHNRFALVPPGKAAHLAAR